jgi:hypothetical protein
MASIEESKIPVHIACTDTLIQVKIQFIAEDPTTEKIHVVKELTANIKPGDKEYYCFAAHDINEPKGTGLPTYSELGQADLNGTLFKNCKEASAEQAAEYRDNHLYFEEQYYTIYKSTDPTLPEEERFRQVSEIIKEHRRVLADKARTKRLNDNEYIAKIAKRLQLAEQYGFDRDTTHELENPEVLAGLLRKTKTKKSEIEELTSDEEQYKEQSRKRAALNKADKPEKKYFFKNN